MLAAWCSPKGRVQVSGRLIDIGESVGFVVPRTAADDVARRLLMYRFRAKVEIAVTAETPVAVACATDAVTGLDCQTPNDWLETARQGDALCVGLGGGAVELYAAGPAGAATLGDLPTIDEDLWRQRRIEAGLVDVDESNADRFTPHMLSLERTGAVSFSKGCYTGQEIVARTEHRGRVKRRIAGFRVSGDTPISPGAKLAFEGQEVGEVAAASRHALLAVINDQARGQALEVAGVAAEPFPLPWEASDRSV